MRTILITGATGFLGSSAAFSFLQAGRQVVAISRRDRDGDRTRSAVRKAAAAFGYEGDASELLGRLTVFSAKSPELAHPEAFSRFEVDEVWHFAAEMTYSISKLAKSMHSNVTSSLALYKLVEKHSVKRPRFYYISTAYSVGVPTEEIVSEGPHYAPSVVNAYQLSKWTSEMVLAQYAQDKNTLPLTIVRPGIVIGHSTSGWNGGKPYGIYMFLDSLGLLLRTKVRELAVDLPPENGANLAPVDYVTRAVLSLSDGHGKDTRQAVEWVNVTGVDFSIQRTASLVKHNLGIQAFFRKPVTILDGQYAKHIAENASFASTKFRFATGNLERFGESPPSTVTEDSIDMILVQYLEKMKGNTPKLPPRQNLALQLLAAYAVLQTRWFACFRRTKSNDENAVGLAAGIMTTGKISSRRDSDNRNIGVKS